MAEKRLSIGLFLNDKQFQSGLRKATKSMQKFGKSMQKTGKQLTTSLTLPIVAFGAASVKAFDEQIKAETKLRTALGGSEEAFDRLKQQAQELQKVTLFGDEATIEAASFLAQLGLNENAISRLLPLIQDFATAQNMQLGDAAKLVAKSVGSSTNALSRYGITIEGAVGETERLDSAVNALSTAFGGQAEAVAKEGLGPFQQLKNELGDVAEQFGKIILENIEPLKKALSSLAERLRSLTSEQKENIIKWGAIIAALGPALVIFGKLITAGAALGKALMFLSANPMVLITTAIIGLVGLLGFAVLDMEGFIKTALSLGKIGKLVAKSIIMFADATGLMSKPEALAAIATIDGMAKSEEELAKDLTDSTDKIKEQEKELNKLKSSLKDVNKELDKGSEKRKPNFREIDRIEPKQAGAVDNNISGGPLTAVLPEELTEAELPPMLQPSYYDELASKVSNLGNILMNVWSGAFDVMNSFYERQLENIDREKEEALLKLEREHAYTTLLQQEEAKRFNAMSREEKKKFRLREDLEKKQLAIEEEMAKKKRAIARKQAKMQKASALFAAIVNTASAVAEALPNVPLSIAVGIAGAGQVAAIASQPLPELADGGIAFGDTIARVGEYQGASVNPEVIAPLNKLESMLGMNTVNVVGTISGEDIVLASERFGERANRLD